MALSGIGGATPNEEPKQINGNDKLETHELNGENKQPCSIWDSNSDGKVSIEEQRDALQNAVVNDKDIKLAKKMGFDPQPFIDALSSQFEDIVTNTPKQIGNFIIPVKVLIESANRKVQGYVDTIKDKANEFIDNHIKETFSFKNIKQTDDKNNGHEQLKNPADGFLDPEERLRFH